MSKALIGPKNPPSPSFDAGLDSSEMSIHRKEPMVARVQIRPLSMIVVAAAGLGALAVATAGTAAAGPMAEDFLHQVEAQGIAYDDARLAEVDGQLVCSRLWSGETPDSIATDMNNTTDLTDAQAAYFVSTAISFYCPENT